MNSSEILTRNSVEFLLNSIEFPVNSDFLLLNSSEIFTGISRDFSVNSVEFIGKSSSGMTDWVVGGFTSALKLRLFPVDIGLALMCLEFRIGHKSN